MFAGVLTGLLAIFTPSSFLWLAPFILLVLLGIFVRCPVCRTPVGYVPEGMGTCDTSERCPSCGHMRVP
jgi:hypothetical protein